MRQALHTAPLLGSGATNQPNDTPAMSQVPLHPYRQLLQHGTALGGGVTSPRSQTPEGGCKGCHPRLQGQQRTSPGEGDSVSVLAPLPTRVRLWGSTSATSASLFPFLKQGNSTKRFQVLLDSNTHYSTACERKGWC